MNKTNENIKLIKTYQRKKAFLEYLANTYGDFKIGVDALQLQIKPTSLFKTLENDDQELILFCNYRTKLPKEDYLGDYVPITQFFGNRTAKFKDEIEFLGVRM